MFDAGHCARNSWLALTSVPEQKLQILRLYRECLHEMFERLKDTHAGQHMLEIYRTEFRFELASADIDVLNKEAEIKNKAKLPAVSPFLPPEIQTDSDKNLSNMKFKPGEPAFVTAKIYRIDDKEVDSRRLPKERMNYAIRETRLRFDEFRSDAGDLDALFNAGHRACEARLDLANIPELRLILLTEYLEFLKEIEKLNQTRFDANKISKQQLEHAHFERLTAEIDLLRAKDEMRVRANDG
jgi:hypothetical protein